MHETEVRINDPEVVAAFEAMVPARRTAMKTGMLAAEAVVASRHGTARAREHYVSAVQDSWRILYRD